jgi:hypothetical protein
MPSLSFYDTNISFKYLLYNYIIWKPLVGFGRDSIKIFPISSKIDFANYS